MALHRYIGSAAAARHLLTNVADMPELCDFYLSSVLQKGDLKIAISTNGKSPTIGKRLREVLAEVLPAELASVLGQMTIIRSRLQGDFAQKVKSLNAVTAELANGPAYETPATAYWRRVATARAVHVRGFHPAQYPLLLLHPGAGLGTWRARRACSTPSWPWASGAQLVDGLLGMGYGVVSAISLMSLGLSPVSVSASIHTAEMFASGASGYHHYRFGNVNRRLFRVLLLPGIAGSVGGALLLAHFGEAYAGYIKPCWPCTCSLLGLRIITKALRKQPQQRRKVKNAGWLAGAGGFLDSFGGGGWGPLVTSTLIANGRTPQFVIGTVSLVEFFVTFASALHVFCHARPFALANCGRPHRGRGGRRAHCRPAGRPHAHPLDVRGRGPDGHRLEPVGPAQAAVRSKPIRACLPLALSHHQFAFSMRQRFLPILLLADPAGVQQVRLQPRSWILGKAKALRYRTGNNMPVGPKDPTDWTSDDDWNRAGARLICQPRPRPERPQQAGHHPLHHCLSESFDRAAPPTGRCKPNG